MAKAKSAQNFLVWMLMGLLVAGLAGFGIDGFLTQRVTSIGSVGTREIPAQDYARQLQQEINGFQQQIGQPVPFAQAQALGIDRQVRAQLVTQAALESEAERIGISIGDENVLTSIQGIPAFRGPGGAFDMANYRFQLENIGLTPGDFEDNVRRDAARERVGSAGTWEDPRISYEASNLPIGDFNFRSSPMSGNQFGLRQKIPFPGLLGNQRGAARSGSEAAQSDLEDRIVRVSGIVEARWAMLGFAQRALDITRPRDVARVVLRGVIPGQRHARERSARRSRQQHLVQRGQHPICGRLVEDQLDRSGARPGQLL